MRGRGVHRRVREKEEAERRGFKRGHERKMQLAEGSTAVLVANGGCKRAPKF